CLTCGANGDCELQDMAGAVGLRDVRYGYEGENHVFAKSNGEVNAAWMPKDESNPYFTYDPSKCIVCSRCVRACEEVQGTFALTISGRGFDSRVSPGMSESFLGSECFAWGYTNHKERILKPMIRERIEDPWREVSWDEAFSFAADRMRGIQKKYGRDSIGGITSSRCTNEETYLVQKLIRAGFGNNNVD